MRMYENELDDYYSCMVLVSRSENHDGFAGFEYIGSINVSVDN